MTKPQSSARVTRTAPKARPTPSRAEQRAAARGRAIWWQWLLVVVAVAALFAGLYAAMGGSNPGGTPTHRPVPVGGHG